MALRRQDAPPADAAEGNEGGAVLPAMRKKKFSKTYMKFVRPLPSGTPFGQRIAAKRRINAALECFEEQHTGSPTPTHRTSSSLHSSPFRRSSSLARNASNGVHAKDSSKDSLKERPANGSVEEKAHAALECVTQSQFAGLVELEQKVRADTWKAIHRSKRSKAAPATGKKGTPATPCTFASGAVCAQKFTGGTDETIAEVNALLEAYAAAGRHPNILSLVAAYRVVSDDGGEAPVNEAGEQAEGDEEANDAAKPAAAAEPVPEQFWILTEWADGGVLEDALGLLQKSVKAGESERLSAAQVVALIQNILRSLRYLHARDVSQGAVVSDGMLAMRDMRVVLDPTVMKKDDAKSSGFEQLADFLARLREQGLVEAEGEEQQNQPEKEEPQEENEEREPEDAAEPANGGGDEASPDTLSDFIAACRSSEATAETLLVHPYLLSRSDSGLSSLLPLIRLSAKAFSQYAKEPGDAPTYEAFLSQEI
ncbi:hypothetical protein DIPPA_25262 [Diplonema papillatum]|nr:hypothetical protein DIPPA_25262 [Diplonema papillatum]|eukprot:gene22027-33787_t